MKNMMVPTFSVWVVLAGFVTLAACTTCNCTYTVDCVSGNDDGKIYVCEFGTGCEPDSKGNAGLCVDAFADPYGGTTPTTGTTTP